MHQYYNSAAIDIRVDSGWFVSLGPLNRILYYLYELRGEESVVKNHDMSQNSCQGADFPTQFCTTILESYQILIRRRNSLKKLA